MRLLAVDTSTPRGSVAIVSEEGALAEVRMTPADGHSGWILPAVELALRGLGLDVSALDGFAVTTGPGSFTGLRVGISTVQGLALAAGRLCVGMSSLDVLALAATGRAPTVVALVDAFRDQVFSGVYAGDGRPLGERRVGSLAAVLDRLEGEVAFVGDGALRYREAIAAAMASAVFPPVDLFLATRLGQAAIRGLREGRGEPPGALRPLYLRGADIRKTER